MNPPDTRRLALGQNGKNPDSSRARPAASASRRATTASPVCSTNSPSPAETDRIPSSYSGSPGRGSSSSTTGGSLRSQARDGTTCGRLRGIGGRHRRNGQTGPRVHSPGETSRRGHPLDMGRAAPRGASARATHPQTARPPRAPRSAKCHGRTVRERARTESACSPDTRSRCSPRAPGTDRLREDRV